MFTIYKYIIEPSDSKVVLPIGAKILSVFFQMDELCMWAEVDTEKEDDTRYFEVFGTGHKIPYRMGVDYSFIGTAHMNNGLVFHVFERFGI